MRADSVLFVVYEFPPEGSRGTKRSLKFIRYLPQYGWHPVVLTVRGANYSFHDGSLIEELPRDLAVYRARTLETFFTKRQKQAEGKATVSSAPVGKASASLFSRAALWVYHTLGKFTRIPDSRILWLPFALAKGLRAIRETRCRLIYSSGPTHTNHIVGALLSRLTGLPLFMDFRDAWVGDPADVGGNRWVKWANSFLERLCIRVAKQVVCTTDGIQADFEVRYPRIAKKYTTITNGFDSSDFTSDGEQATFHGRPGVLSILHAGTLGGERSPKEFLAALGQLLSEKPEMKDRLEVVFVGQNSRFEDGRTIEEYVREYACGSVINIAGYVSRKQSLEYMQRAGVLLMIVGRVPKEGAFVYGISGKIYDYAAARKPVLTIAEPGSTAEMAQRLNLGPVVHPDNTQGLKSVLTSLCEVHAGGAIPYNLDVELLKSFEFSSLTARLAKCFDEACEFPPVEEPKLVRRSTERV